MELNSFENLSLNPKFLKMKFFDSETETNAKNEILLSI